MEVKCFFLVFKEVNFSLNTFQLLIFSFHSFALREVINERSVDNHLLSEARVDAVLFVYVKVLLIEVGHAVVKALTRRVKEVSGGCLEVDELLVLLALHIHLSALSLIISFQNN